MTSLRSVLTSWALCSVVGCSFLLDVDGLSSAGGRDAGSDRIEDQPIDASDRDRNDSTCTPGCAVGSCIGGNCVTVLAEGQPELGGLAVGHSFVAWTSMAALVVLADDAGAPTTMYTDSKPLVKDVRWTGNAILLGRNSGSAGHILKCNSTFNCLASVSSMDNVIGFVEDGVTTFTATTQGIRACDQPMCTVSSPPREVVSANEGPFTDLAVGGARVFWVTGTNPGHVRSAAKNAVDVEGTDVMSDQASPRGITADATYIYWTLYDSGDVMRCAVDASGACTPGGSTVIHHGNSSDRPSRIVLGEGNLYWIEEGARRVLRCPVAGCSGPPLVVLSDLQEPRRLAVSNGVVYVADWGTGRIVASTPTP